MNIPDVKWFQKLLVTVLGTASLGAQTFQFTSVQKLTNQEVMLNLSAPTGRAYRIESTASLPQWSGLFTFGTNLVTSSLTYTDSAALFLDGRLYRAVQLEGTNIVAGDHLATTNGDVIIQPRYHATFVMQWNGKMIYSDPDSDATYTGLPKADVILVSHSHGDHFDVGTIQSVRGPEAVIICPLAVYNGLTAAQKQVATVLTYGQSTNVHGITVEAVVAFNSNHSPLGFANGYVVTIGGKRIYISGDTGNQPELRALTDIDVAFVCMNLPFTMSVNDATNLVHAMQPRVVYPYHYRDQGGSTANAANFKQRLGTSSGIEVRLRRWY